MQARPRRRYEYLLLRDHIWRDKLENGSQRADLPRPDTGVRAKRCVHARSVCRSEHLRKLSVHGVYPRGIRPAIALRTSTQLSVRLRIAPTLLGRLAVNAESGNALEMGRGLGVA
jgi:hypothetical protein